MWNLFSSLCHSFFFYDEQCTEKFTKNQAFVPSTMSIPTQQKALVVPSLGADFVLKTVDVPTPGAGEILVRVDVAGLNPVDWKAREWGIVIAEYPAILGCEVTGVVVQVGPEVTTRSVGDLIAFQANPTYARNGAYQQFTIVKATMTTQVPSNLTKDEAATISGGLVTSVHALYTDYIPTTKMGGANLIPFWREGGRGKYAGTPLVVFGGASSNGQCVIQFARLSGFSPIIATASLRNEDLLKSLGVTHVVDRNLNATDLISAIRGITSKPTQLVYDAIADADTQNLAYDLLSSGGKLLLSLPPVIDQARITPDKQVFSFSGQTDHPEYAAIDEEFYAVLQTYLKSGDIKALIPEYLPGGLASVPEGLERLKRNGVSARKLVIHLEDTA
ncbi:hypothetical protein QCA50_017324 [Cerrena zonata]|uniref:Enoyl reductase (ER) domain-containing protein n=1 Tax=Cerrena zonata TaxID=2478898 RepID=A0AAW0FDF4_9APHY